MARRPPGCGRHPPARPARGTPFDWGGYLIWKAPGYRVSIDGRADLHEDRLDRYASDPRRRRLGGRPGPAGRQRGDGRHRRPAGAGAMAASPDWARRLRGRPGAPSSSAGTRDERGPVCATPLMPVSARRAGARRDRSPCAPTPLRRLRARRAAAMSADGPAAVFVYGTLMPGRLRWPLIELQATGHRGGRGAGAAVRHRPGLAGRRVRRRRRDHRARRAGRAPRPSGSPICSTSWTSSRASTPATTSGCWSPPPTATPPGRGRPSRTRAGFTPIDAWTTLDER